MTGKISGNRIVFLGLAAVVLGLGVASASKAVKTAKKVAAAKPAAAKPAAVKPAVKTATVKSAPGTTAPAGSAGWVYHKPGSPMPHVTAPRGVEPRGEVVQNSKNGVRVKLPPMTYSVATVDSKGQVNYDCEPAAAAKTGANHRDHK